MIRINLAKSQSYAPMSAGTVTNMDFKSLGAGANANLLFKVGGLLLTTILLIAYENYTISIKNTALARVTTQAAALQEEIKGFGSVDQVLENLGKEKAKMNEQLTVIEKISQKRAFKLQAILTAQKGLPEDVWLEEFNFYDSTIILKGFSRTPTSVQEFVQALNNTDFILSAVNKELSRVKMGDQQVQKFEIEARVLN